MEKTGEISELIRLRAGYIEHWGRGIQKICDACKELGAELPVYELLEHGIRVHFKALQSALIDQPKIPKDQSDTLVDKIVALLNLSFYRCEK